MLQIKNTIKSYYVYIIVALLSFFLRLFNFQNPKNDFSMDEVYYIPESVSVLRYGYERAWVESQSVKGWNIGFSEAFFNGTADVINSNWVSSHPPLGKIFIAIGMFFFGDDNPLGWKISAIIFGTLTVLMGMIIANRLFKNKFITVLSGIFLAIDPMSIAMSRTVHLDIFLTLITMLGVYFTILYLDKYSLKHALLLSIFFGLATAIKWSGLYFYTIFGLAIFISLILNKTLRKKWTHIIYSLLAYISAYILSWSLWFINYAIPNKNGIAGSFSFFVEEHIRLLTSHSGIDSTHPYKTNALEWIMPSRPTALQSEINDASNTVMSVFSTPNLVLWICSIIALIIVFTIEVRKYYRTREISKTWILFVAILAGWGPWFLVGDRTIFQFYTVIFQPYLYIVLTLLLYTIFKNENGKKLSILRMVAFTIIAASIAISFRMYSSATAIETPKMNSGYALNSQWQKAMINLGLYDINQLPEKDRTIYE